MLIVVATAQARARYGNQALSVQSEKINIGESVAQFK